MKTCPYNTNTDLTYCVEGVCQRNVAQWVDYLGCCTGPLFCPDFNLTSCGITDITPCSSVTSNPSEIPSPSETPNPSKTRSSS